MLNYIAIGPLPDGSYAVAYQTPGCGIYTLACPCRNEQQALDESLRRNEASRSIDAILQRERAMSELTRIVADRYTWSAS